MKARTIAAALAAITIAALSPADAARPATITLEPFRLDPTAAAQIQRNWTEQMLATHKPGTWAPLKYEVSDADLALLGLPSKKVLLSRRYPEPTMVSRDGRFTRVELPMASNKGSKSGSGKGGGKGGGGSGGDPGGSQLGPTVATFAGAGWFGIRPGALLLLMSGGGIGWCSMAHVYGAAGAYKVSTAGHCGKVGDVATVIAAFGNQNGALNPILLDFGTFATSHDNGLGDDWALVSIASKWQSLVTPTMAAWGGPRGVYTKQGHLAALNFQGNNLIPSPSVTPDPALAQTLVHYGHGLGAHTLVTPLAASVFGGTPRAGEGISWGANHFLFNGYIAPGDSGSGANVLTGDAPGDNMEAAGIITHLWIDPLMRSGIGLMGGTRTTRVGTPANGQLVPYPVPVTGLP